MVEERAWTITVEAEGVERKPWLHVQPRRFYAGVILNSQEELDRFIGELRTAAAEAWPQIAAALPRVSAEARWR